MSAIYKNHYRVLILGGGTAALRSLLSFAAG